MLSVSSKALRGEFTDFCFPTQVPDESWLTFMAHNYLRVMDFSENLLSLRHSSKIAQPNEFH